MECWCNRKLSLDDNEILEHIKGCNYYLRRCHFLNILDKIPPESPESDYRLMLVELKLVEKELTNRLKSKMNGTKPKPIPSKMQIQPQPVSSYYNVQSEFGVEDARIVQCLECKKRFYSDYDIQSLFYVWECCHLFCKPCVVRYINKQFVPQQGNIKCPLKECKMIMIPQSYFQLIGKERVGQLQRMVLMSMTNIIQCGKCKAQFDFVKGKVENVKDQTGKPLTPAMQQHYAENRFNCPKCNTNQCKNCKVVPYHIGKNCEQFKKHSQSKKCRYCGDVMPEINSKSGIRAFEDICNKKDCQELVRTACSKINVCGHPCRGFTNQKKCIPCLDEKCAATNAALLGQKGDDYCGICWSEALDSAPCIQSNCGHIFHLKCVSKRLEVRWTGPRIVFNYCVCPVCKKWLSFPEQSVLHKKMVENQLIFTKIQNKCLERLKFEGCEKDQKLVKPGSPFYQKPLEYAMAIFSYYQCFKCKQPYFGGRKSCQNVNDGQGEYKPQQLICSNCCQIPIENCPKHGKQYIEFKCKFCCTVAQWFCWGNTHFCENCHQRQCKGEYISKLPKDKLPKCEGPGKCPVGGNHHGNGDERPLGCAICRNIKQAGKNF